MNNKISKSISFVFVLFILANSIVINFSKDGLESTETGFRIHRNWFSTYNKRKRV